jgi:tetratricopeptide (TPR) repeat protein
MARYRRAIFFCHYEEMKLPHFASPRKRPASLVRLRTEGSQGLKHKVFSPIGILVIAGGLAGSAVLLGFWLSKPAPHVPVPASLDKLEPQLRAYVGEKVQWVRDAPRSPDRQATLGMVYAANALWAEARLAFSNVVQLSPKEPLAHLYVAVATQELGEMSESAALLRSVTERFPDFAPGFYRLGEVSLRLGAVAEAERAFQRLISLAPQEWRGHAGLGEVRLRQERYEEAVTLLEHAIQLDPEAKRAHNLLGLAYRAVGRMEEAKLELSLGMNPTTYPMPDAWSRRVPEHMRLLQDQLDMANEYAAAGRAQKAVELLETALQYHPDNVGLLNALAIAYNRAGLPERAEPVLKKALTINERYLPARVTLSFTLQAAGRSEQALAEADHALALSPNTTQAHMARANALLGMERDREALEALQAAADCDPKNAEIQMEIGDVYWLNLEQPDEAVRHYHTATNLNPVLWPVYVRLADYHLQKRNHEAVQPLLALLRRLAPRSPELPLLENRAKQQEQEP